MSKQPTKAERAMWDRLASMGCIICASPASIHHAETGMGGRKDHKKVIPLCHYHHQGDEGIHTLSRRVWQQKYGTEQELMIKAQERLWDK